jgi:hypothetical protein
MQTQVKGIPTPFLARFTMTDSVELGKRQPNTSTLLISFIVIVTFLLSMVTLLLVNLW